VLIGDLKEAGRSLRLVDPDYADNVNLLAQIPESAQKILEAVSYF